MVLTQGLWQACRALPRHLARRSPRQSRRPLRRALTPSRLPSLRPVVRFFIASFAICSPPGPGSWRAECSWQVESYLPPEAALQNPPWPHSGPMISAFVFVHLRDAHFSRLSALARHPRRMDAFSPLLAGFLPASPLFSLSQMATQRDFFEFYVESLRKRVPDLMRVSRTERGLAPFSKTQASPPRPPSRLRLPRMPLPV